MCKGLTNREIAGVLEVAESTVKSHVRAVCDGLAVTNRTEAVAVAALAEAQSERSAFFERPAVAVLRLEHPPGDGAMGVTAFGLVSDLIMSLSRWRWFPVIARGTSMHHSASEHPDQVGRAIGARYLLGGEIAAQGAGVTLRLQLVDAEQGHCIWAERYELSRAELTGAQDGLAQKTVANIFPVLVRHEGRRAAEQALPSASVWQQVHEGILLVERRNPTDNACAHGLFDAALRAREDFLPAGFGKGLAHFQDLCNAWTGDVARSLEQVEAWGERCVALDPDQALGYYLRGRGLQARAQPKEAAAQLDRAIECNPSLAAAHALLGEMLVQCEQPERGLGHLGHAERLDPRASIAGMASAYFAAGDYPRAVTAARRVIVARPGYAHAHAVLCAASQLLGRVEDAADARDWLGREAPGYSIDAFRALMPNPESAAVQHFLGALADAGLD